MVIVKDAHLRKGQDEKTFVSLELAGDIELVQSQNTGRFYATVRRAFVSATFDLPTAQLFVGKTLPGKIERVEAEPYDYTIPDSGEIVILNYSYQYVPEGESKFAPIEKESNDVHSILARAEMEV